MEKEKVSIVKVSEYSDISEAIASAVELAGGLDDLVEAYDEILIKPNLQRVKNFIPGINTSKEVIRAIVNITNKLSDTVTIVEADATSGPAEDAFANGWYTLAEELGINILNASKDQKTIVKVPRPVHFKEMEISERVYKGFRLSVPVMKVARDVGVSLSLKNMFGLLPEKMKMRYHLRPGIFKTIVDTNQLIYPNFVIVDGTIGLEGAGGPLNGTSVHMDIILAGKDPVAVDTVTSMIMGFEPQELPFLKAANDAGIGVCDMNSIEVVGTPIEEVKVPFKRSGGFKGTIAIMKSAMIKF